MAYTGFKVNTHNNHYSTFYLLNFSNGVTDVSEKVRQTSRFVEVEKKITEITFFHSLCVNLLQ